MSKSSKLEKIAKNIRACYSTTFRWSTDLMNVLLDRNKREKPGNHQTLTFSPHYSRCGRHGSLWGFIYAKLHKTRTVGLLVKMKCSQNLTL